MIPHEEKQTVKWFLLFFYIIYIGYDLFYYYLFPALMSYTKKIGFPSEYWYINYIVLGILIPVAYYLNKTNQQFKIKYVFFLIFLFTAFVVDILSYYGSGDSYASGNMVEVY